MILICWNQTFIMQRLGSSDFGVSSPTSTLKWTTNRKGWRHSKSKLHWSNNTFSTISSFSVNVKFNESGHGLTVEEATAIRTELLNIQQSLYTGEQEKIELMKSLACLKDDLTRLQHSESSLDVSAINAHEKLSTASQTDLSGEVSNW